jgi:hypothetical protein
MTTFLVVLATVAVSFGFGYLCGRADEIVASGG